MADQKLWKWMFLFPIIFIWVLFSLLLPLGLECFSVYLICFSFTLLLLPVTSIEQDTPNKGFSKAFPIPKIKSLLNKYLLYWKAYFTNAILFFTSGIYGFLHNFIPKYQNLEVQNQSTRVSYIIYVKICIKPVQTFFSLFSFWIFWVSLHPNFVIARSSLWHAGIGFIILRWSFI